MEHARDLDTPTSQRGQAERQTGVSSPVMNALSRLHERALQEQALSKKVKELIALATAITTGCDTSIAYHLHNALEAGATEQEIVETLDVVLVTMGEPAVVHGTQILKALSLDEADQPFDEQKTSKKDRLYERATAHPYMSPD